MWLRVMRHPLHSSYTYVLTREAMSREWLVMVRIACLKVADTRGQQPQHNAK